MTIARALVDRERLNPEIRLPYELRRDDFAMAMQDVYDFFHDVNAFLLRQGLRRMDDFLRPATMSGILSDMLTESLAKHSRTLTQNKQHNGHPDLVMQGRYPGDAVKAGSDGVEIKSTRKKGGGVDTHGGRNQWMCVFVYEVDGEAEPAAARAPMRFSEVYIAKVAATDFRKNERGELGTRTAALAKDGLRRLREGWIYKLN